MNGLDCLVFTGVLEKHLRIREKVLSGMDYIGIKPDLIKNKEKNNGGIRDITAIGGKVKILIIPTNEELVIARETYELVNKLTNIIMFNIIFGCQTELCKLT
jgi:acetate kinase